MCIRDSFHEWMTSSGGLYLQKHSPYVASVFTTHATVMGRSIAGNGMPLYGDMPQLNADDLARRFGVVAKHSLEKTAAANYDCFTTVSNLTAKECKYLLGSEADSESFSSESTNTSSPLFLNSYRPLVPTIRGSVS
mgnify:CR=1 FL=1